MQVKDFVDQLEALVRFFDRLQHCQIGILGDTIQEKKRWSDLGSASASGKGLAASAACRACTSRIKTAGAKPCAAWIAARISFSSAGTSLRSLWKTTLPLW